MPLSPISANAIIVDALQKIGIYAPNETLNDSDAVLGLTQLNDLIDNWLGDSIYMWQIVELMGNVTVEMASYTVGPGGMFPASLRPPRVVMGRAVASLVSGSPPSSSLVDSVSAPEWDAIYFPANNVSIPFKATPAVMYYEPQYPLGILSVSPLPAKPGVLTFPALFGMPNFSSLTTSFAMAPAQEQGLKANLAIALNPYFGGSLVSPELVAEAQDTKTVLSLVNRLSRAMNKRNREPPARGVAPRQG